MAILSVRDYVNAELNGQTWTSSLRKTVSQTNIGGYWCDTCLWVGSPPPNYYATTQGVSVAMSSNTKAGLDHGPNVSQLGYKKFLKTVTLSSAALSGSTFLMCDYLMYYPFLDQSVPGFYSMTNTASLPRYTSGVGVKIMAVIAGAPSGIGNPRFQVQYTNSSGVTGQLTPYITTGAGVSVGTLINTNISGNALCVGPFLPLAQGDVGVQKIEAINIIDTDVGLINLVLVYPLALGAVRTADAPVERNYLSDFSLMPQIQDGAYLNFIMCSATASLTNAILAGSLTTVWG